MLQAGALLPLMTACAPDLLGDPDVVRIGVSWSGTELAAFRAVLDGLAGVSRVEVVPLGDDIGTAFTASGRAAPDLVMLPQAGQVRGLAAAGELTPLDKKTPLWAEPGAPSSASGESPLYLPYWRQLLFHDGTPYGIPFKASAKSLVWFDRESVDQYRLGDPSNWTVEDWIDKAEVLARTPIRLLALAAADGWVLTDLFENMLLAESPRDYGELAAAASDRDRRWDRAAVRAALGRLGALWGGRSALPGGLGRALTRQFPDAVREVFDRRTAVMVVMPDFAEPVVRRCLRHTGRSRDVVGATWFPSIRRHSPKPRIVGGDVVVLTRQAGPAAVGVVEALAAPQAPGPWIREGGFLSPNLRTSNEHRESFLPAGIDLSHCAFDLSDRISRVGGRDGLWRVLTDFLIEVGDGDGGVQPAIDRAVLALNDFGRTSR
ncbi:extracellular solute-binding protein [Nocardia sp. NPDC005366]|uniref:extracellular solute-binding protein n=1 Tax=Nocardia sp. NPDC005366 TaxID=3156878 RepID=UPI0033BA7EEE